MNSIAHLKRAGRLGGLARIRMYGNPGTAEGRRRGGINSLKTHKRRRGGFKVLRRIKFPRRSEELAELLGIFMGDGHVGEYQSSVTTNSETDIAHALFVQRLIRKLFAVPVRLRFRSKVSACELVTSSKEVCRFLQEQGMSSGNKVRDGVEIPPWIQENERYAKAFVRGLFDTDGCVYLDRHRYKDQVYKNVGIAFTNRTLSLLEFFKKRLEALGMRPTQKTRFTVFLRREEEIRRYFKTIGTSNPKHRRRLSKFLRIRSGGVA